MLGNFNRNIWEAAVELLVINKTNINRESRYFYIILSHDVNVDAKKEFNKVRSLTNNILLSISLYYKHTIKIYV